MESVPVASELSRREEWPPERGSEMATSHRGGGIAMRATATEIDEVIVDLSSGYGSVAALEKLADSLLITRMFRVRTLVVKASKLPELIDGARLHLAYGALADLQRSHPAEVAALLTYPHTGPWLADVLERIDASEDDSATPLWADCGYLGWLAAAASVTCRPEGSMTLVVRGGVAMLPGIGMARLGPTGDYGHCELHWTADGALRFARGGTTLVVPSPDEETDPSWLPLRRMRGADGEKDVLLDDLDPFRATRADQPTPPRLAAGHVALWQDDFVSAWDLLDRDFARYLTPMRGCLRMVAPLGPRPRTASHTSFHGVGCVYTSVPADPCQLALTLIREIQHTKFTLLNDQVRLFDPDTGARFYVPWHDDPRPILDLVRGIYAFFGVTDFWRVHRDADCHRSMRSHVDFALWRMRVEGAIARALSSGLLTTAGEHLMKTLRDAMRPWSAEEVSAEARRAATEVSTAHRTFWRVRNLTLGSSDIADLVAGWRAQDPPPAVLPPAIPVDQRSIPNHHRHLYLSESLTQRGIGEEAAVFTLDQPCGDRAYLAGDVLCALARYAEEMRSDPLRPQLWAGLAVTLPTLDPETDYRMLSEHPEVMAGLYAALRAESEEVGILELLRWLSSGTLADRELSGLPDR
ncbi:HEXXH motif domain-containing protein [Nocardia sp. NPDC050710]|uniref:HEXXH motif domain-containing protein n=1 Tax=Nocardia sp. NPDC050710 TaxID=3157220 RepID=UPI00340E0D93